MATADTSFLPLIGFDEQIKLIKKLIDTNRLPQVLLFEGTAGIGKTHLLKHIVALHLCYSGTACGKCAACKQILALVHPDVQVVVGSDKSIKVADIVEVSDFLSYAPQSLKAFRSKRFILIPDVDKLTNASINKLLKTFEEPAASAQILLSTSCSKSLLETLLSRCVRWKLRPPSLQQNLEFFRQHPSAQSCEPKQLEELIQRANLSPGMVLKHLQEPKYDSLAKLAKELLKVTSASQATVLAEQIKMQADSSLFDFLYEYEYALNDLYKDCLEGKQKIAEHQIQNRRTTLRELKYYIRKQKIALNTQLALECLALSNLRF